MACDSPVCPNTYIPSVTGPRLRDEFGKYVPLPYSYANWDLTKMGDREGLRNTLCSQGQRDHCEHLI